MEIKKFVFNAFQENTYVIWDNESKEAAVIDPGCYTEQEKEKLKNFIISSKLKLRYLINTHCHIDHILGNAFVQKEFSPDYLIHKKDLFLIDIQYEHCKNYGFELEKFEKPNLMIDKNDMIKLGDTEINLLFTPGHSPGEISLYNKKSSRCITGDVLFREGIGRTDLWGGEYFTLMDSIQDVLFNLSDQTIIYPGHGPESSIGHEKENNPFI